MTTDTAVNGVDLAAVGALVGRIQQEPEAAATVWSAEVAWKGAFQSEAYIRDFAPIPSDEPTGLGGADTAYEAINVSVDTRPPEPAGFRMVALPSASTSAMGYGRSHGCGSAHQSPE